MNADEARRIAIRVVREAADPDAPEWIFSEAEPLTGGRFAVGVTSLLTDLDSFFVVVNPDGSTRSTSIPDF